MELTPYEQGFQIGLREAREQLLGERGLARLVLTRRFGPLPPEIQERIDRASFSELVDLVHQALSVRSLDAFNLTDAEDR